jgi:hypothetical protein
MRAVVEVDAVQPEAGGDDQDQEQQAKVEQRTSTPGWQAWYKRHVGLGERSA